MHFSQIFCVCSNHVNGGRESFTRSFTVGGERVTKTNNDPSSFDHGGNLLGFNQRVVEIHSMIGSYYYPEQNLTTLTPGEGIRVAEITRTQEIITTKFIHSSSTQELNFLPNERLNMSVFEDQISYPFFYDHRFQHQNQSRDSHHIRPNIDLNIGISQSYDHNLLPYHNNDHYEQHRVLDPNPISMCFNGPHHGNHVSTGSGHCLNLLDRINSEDDDDYYDSDDGYDGYFTFGDGRTHSLPHEKYGPYTCPKCKGIFTTSQHFASHMGSHYKFESTYERRKRRRAKNRGKNIHLLHSKYGLTILPKSFKASDAKKKWKKSTLWISDEESSTEGERVAGRENQVGFPKDFIDIELKLQLC